MNATDGTTASKRHKPDADDVTTEAETPSSLTTVNKRTSVSTKPTSPKEQANAIVDAYLESLPKAIALIGKSLFTKHLDLLLQIEKTNRRIENLGRDQKLPKSMQFKFTLNSIDSIKETQAFKNLSEECNDNIRYCQNILRVNCRMVAEMELLRQKETLQQFFSAAIYLLATAFIKNYSPLENTDRNYLTLVVSAFRRELRQLTEQRDADSAALLISQISDTTQSISEPPPVHSFLLKYSGFTHAIMNHRCHYEFFNSIISENNMSITPASNSEFNTFEDSPTVEPILSTFITALSTLFYTGYDTYANAIATRDRDRDLLAWAESTLNASATHDTAVAMEDINLTSPELGELISSKVNEGTKKTQRRA